MSELGSAVELNDLYGQIDALKAQAELIIVERREQAIADVRMMIEAFGLGPDEIGIAMPTQPKPSTARRRKAERQPARYRDPSSGRTWSGRGRIPLWVKALEAGGLDRAEFLIHAAAQDLRVAA